MTRVKICGITNMNDALAAAEFGADALGFNFYRRSPRYISPSDAREIIDQLDGEVLKVGVFVNEDIETIAAIVDHAGLTGVQLHGDEPPEFVTELRKRVRGDVIKAFRVSDEFSSELPVSCGTDTVLFDGFSKDAFGGTGETFDWEIARTVSKIVERLYLAGGLTPENVHDAIAKVRPFAVDACSSLETSPGVKDAERVKKFIAEAKRDD